MSRANSRCQDFFFHPRDKICPTSRENRSRSWFLLGLPNPGFIFAKASLPMSRFFSVLKRQHKNHRVSSEVFGKAHINLWRLHAKTYIQEWLVLTALICSLFCTEHWEDNCNTLHLTPRSYLPWATDSSKVYQGHLCCFEFTLIDWPLILPRFGCNPHVIGYPFEWYSDNSGTKWYPAIAIHSGDITKNVCSSPSRYLCNQRTQRMWHLQIKLSCLLLWDCLQILPSILLLPVSISSGNNSNLSWFGSKRISPMITLH